MPLAVTHVLLSIIAIDIFRDYIIKKKRLIPLAFLLIGGVAGLLPDIDIPVFWLLNLLNLNVGWFHGRLTHIFLIPAIILILSLIAFKCDASEHSKHSKTKHNTEHNKNNTEHNKNNQPRHNKKIGILLGVISFGYAFHILLDFLFYGCNLSPFWPFFNPVFYGIKNYIHLRNLEMGLDALILLGWLWHEEIRHKISDFI